MASDDFNVNKSSPGVLLCWALVNAAVRDTHCEGLSVL